MGEIEKDHFRFCGWRVAQSVQHVEVSQQDYVDSLLDVPHPIPRGTLPNTKLTADQYNVNTTMVVRLSYLAHGTRPQICAWLCCKPPPLRVTMWMRTRPLERDNKSKLATKCDSGRLSGTSQTLYVNFCQVLLFYMACGGFFPFLQVHFFSLSKECLW
jgi:hypothetical protein